MSGFPTGKWFEFDPSNNGPVNLPTSGIDATQFNRVESNWNARANAKAKADAIAKARANANARARASTIARANAMARFRSTLPSTIGVPRVPPLTRSHAVMGPQFGTQHLFGTHQFTTPPAPIFGAPHDSISHSAPPPAPTLDEPISGPMFGAPHFGAQSAFGIPSAPHLQAQSSFGAFGSLNENESRPRGGRRKRNTRHTRRMRRTRRTNKSRRTRR